MVSFACYFWWFGDEKLCNSSSQYVNHQRRIFITRNEGCTKLCDTNLSPCEKITLKSLSDPSRPLCNDLYKPRSHAKTHTIFSFTIILINVYWNSGVLHFTQILTNWDTVTADFLRNLSWLYALFVLILFYFLYFDWVPVLVEKRTTAYVNSMQMQLQVQINTSQCVRVRWITF